MGKVQFCTPQWLEESSKMYRSNADLQKALAKLSVKMAYRVLADPKWGIDRSIIFCTFFEKGQLTKATFLSEEQTKAEADHLLSATPERWAKLVRKQSSFGADFALGRVKVEIGSKVGVLAVAPYSKNVVNFLSQVKLQYPDEMSKEELEEYRANMEKFRTEMKV